MGILDMFFVFMLIPQMSAFLGDRIHITVF